MLEVLHLELLLARRSSHQQELKLGLLTSPVYHPNVMLHVEPAPCVSRMLALHLLSEHQVGVAALAPEQVIEGAHTWSGPHSAWRPATKCGGRHPEFAQNEILQTGASRSVIIITSATAGRAEFIVALPVWGTMLPWQTDLDPLKMEELLLLHAMRLEKIATCTLTWAHSKRIKTAGKLSTHSYTLPTLS